MISFLIDQLHLLQHRHYYLIGLRRMDNSFIGRMVDASNWGFVEVLSYCFNLLSELERIIS